MVIVMKILNRVIDDNKNIKGYIIKLDNGIVKAASVDACRSYHLSHPFENATLHSDGRFIAKAGERIETITMDDARKLTKGRNTESHALSVSSKVNSLAGIRGKTQKSNGYRLDSSIAGYTTVSICRKLRTAIRQGRLMVDTSRHNSNNGYNQHLFKFITSCGLNVESFIKSYIYNLQPCTLVLDNSSHVKKSSGEYRVILDLGYRVSLYIKISQSGDVIVSFHDSNDNGIGRTGAKRFKRSFLNQTANEYSYILLNEPIRPSDTYEYYDIRMSRGFSVLKQSLSGIYCDRDLIYVSTRELSLSVKKLMLSFLTKLETEFTDNLELRGARDAIENRDRLDVFSFTSYGGSILAKLSLLVDIYSVTTNQVEQQSIMTLAGYLIDEMLFIEDKASLCSMLKDRYMKYSNNVLEHIYLLLGG